jgi:hypothetical protein
MNLNKWVYLLFSLVFFILGGLFIYLSVKNGNKTYLLVFVVISFLLFTFSINTFISKITYNHVKKKMFPKKYFSYKSFKELEEILISNEFKKVTLPYGKRFIKIDGKTCYKVLLVEDFKKYFNQTSANEPKTKGIEYCTKLVGFEIFNTNEKELVDKVEQFSFENEKLLYEGFYIESNKIVEANAFNKVINQNEYNNLISNLDLKEYDAKD